MYDCHFFIFELFLQCLLVRQPALFFTVLHSYECNTAIKVALPQVAVAESIYKLSNHPKDASSWVSLVARGASDHVKTTNDAMGRNKYTQFIRDNSPLATANDLVINSEQIIRNPKDKKAKKKVQYGLLWSTQSNGCKCKLQRFAIATLDPLSLKHHYALHFKCLSCISRTTSWPHKIVFLLVLRELRLLFLSLPLLQLLYKFFVHTETHHLLIKWTCQYLSWKRPNVEKKTSVLQLCDHKTHNGLFPTKHKEGEEEQKTKGRMKTSEFLSLLLVFFCESFHYSFLFSFVGFMVLDLKLVADERSAGYYASIITGVYCVAQFFSRYVTHNCSTY